MVSTRAMRWAGVALVWTALGAQAEAAKANAPFVKSVRECIGPDNRIDEATLRCMRGEDAPAPAPTAVVPPVPPAVIPAAPPPLPPPVAETPKPLAATVTPKGGRLKFNLLSIVALVGFCAVLGGGIGRLVGLSRRERERPTEADDIPLQPHGVEPTPLSSAANFYRRRPLGDVEAALYFRLAKALPEYVILAQVAFGRFIETRGGHSRDEDFWDYAQVRQKAADYLICDQKLDVVAVLALDARGRHPDQDRQLDEILRAAGLKVMRWRIDDLPSEREMRGVILSALAAPVKTR